MDVNHTPSGRWGTKPLESQHQAENAGTANSSPSRQRVSTSVPLDAPKRRTLSRSSVAGFFSRLRPSQRPERGGTARPLPATDSDAEHRPAQPVPPGSSSASRRRKTSPSPARHPPGTIAADRWSTPARAPSQTLTAGPLQSAHLALPRAHSNSPPSGVHSSLQPSTSFSSFSPPRRPLPNNAPLSPPIPFSPTATTATPTYGTATPTPTPTTPGIQTTTPSGTPTATLAAAATARSRELFLAMHCEHRRQRRTLQESGDFLGVTGANPQTGELDVITPPTGSEDAVATTTTTTTTTTNAAATAAATTARVSNSKSNNVCVGAAGGAAPGVGAGVGMEMATGRITTAGSRDAVAKAQRKQQREEERLSRAAQRKDAVREAVRQQRVRWRREEGGWWSSAAEPALSPISGSRSQSQSQSQSASRSSSAALAPAPAPAVASSAAEQSQSHGAGVGSSSGGDGGGGHLRGGQQLHVVIPERRDSFLGMAAVARAVQASRRRLMGEDVKLALVQRRQPEQVRLGAGDGQGKMPGRGWCPWQKTAAGFHVPPAIPPREGSLHPEGSRLEEYHQPEWDLGELVAIPVDIRRLSGDCKVRQVYCGRVVELVDTGNRADSLTPELDNPDHKSPPSRTDMVLRASRPARSGNGPDSAFPSACTRTTTTTGSGCSPARYLLDARPFGATLDGSYDAPLIRRRSTATSLRCSTPRPSSVCSWPMGSPESRQLSGWLSLHSLGLGLRMLMSPTPTQEKGETARPADEPIPLPPSVPGATAAAERAGDTTSSSISQAQTGDRAEAEVVKPPVSQGPVPAKHRAQQPDWAMRKTMRRQSDPDFNRNPNQRDSEAGTPRSSPTCTRTSTYRMTQPSAEAEAEEAAMAAECIARGAARTAFAQNRAHHQETVWVKSITITGVMAGPVSARSPSRQHMDRHPHHGPRAAGAAAQKGRGQGTEEAKQQGEGQEENGKRKGQKRKGKGGAGSGGELEVDVQRWTRMAVVMLERIVGSYWQLVSPVFDGRSELRKRVDRAQATQGDVVVCVLAVLFLFLVMSAVAWAVRGVIWMVKLWGELWDVLRAVAGL